MIKKPILLVFLLLCISSFMNVNAQPELSVITNCSGTQVVRVGVGKFEVRTVEQNMPGCTGTNKSILSSSSSSGEVLQSTEGIDGVVMNCNGTQITKKADGTFTVSQVAKNLPSCVVSADLSGSLTRPLIDLSNGPLFDIKSTEIMSYRSELLRQKGVRFVNAMRSLKMRRQASMSGTVNAYLMKNDAVVVSGKESAWTQVQGAELRVVDDKENIVNADTTKKAKGYVVRKYLRNPNTTDLVRIGQADHAYWSDIAHVKVSHLVNLRANPWYGAKILRTLTNNTHLFVVATVDNWSEVRNDDGTIHGYVRSDYIVVDKAQRVDNWIGIK